MRPTFMHVRAALIAAVLTGLAACNADSPISPSTDSENNQSNIAASARGTYANKAPTGWIVTPANNSSWAQGASISFTATASDPEQGTLSGSSLVWKTSIDGQIGTGTSFTRNNLSVGTHTITMTVTDAQGASFSHHRTIIITGAANTPPVAAISAPSNNASVVQGTSVSFAGSASDAQSGALSGAALVWNSSVAGQIGTGTSFSTSGLAAGTHAITMVATDPQGAADTAFSTLIVTAPVSATNQAPTANIIAPTLSSFVQGTSISFSGTGSDPEDGALSGASLVWSSSVSGQIGTGTSFAYSNLPVGTQAIYLTVKDSKGATYNTHRTITVTAAPSVNTAPVASFNASCVLLVCSFDASGSTDNAGITNYAWNFGSGVVNRTTALISNTFLVAGTVNVSLTVSDAAGLTSTVTKSVTMSSGTTSSSSAGGVEPTGMSLLTETAFNCIGGCGEWSWWDQSYSGAATIGADASAPKSGSSVVQQNFTPSLSGGTSPGAFGTTLVQKQTLYVAMWMKLSSNYQGHGSGVNKVLHFFTKGGRNVVIFNVRGSGSGTLVPGFLTQGLGASYQGMGTEVNFDAAASTCTVARGSWAKYEILMKNNTPGSPDGTLELWMNGTKCVTVTGVTIVGSGENNKWEEISWSPTWGGTGDAITSSFYEAVDHIYVSGK